MGIEVRVKGRGVAAGEDLRFEPQTAAACDLCARDTDAVVNVGPSSFACSDCLRERLGAVSIAKWRLQDDHKTPWGKVSG